KPSSRSIPEGVEAFRRGYQLRRLAFDQTLAADEIRNVSIQHFDCSAVAQIERLMPTWDKKTDGTLDDKARAALMLDLLQRARNIWKTPDQAQLLETRMHALRLYLSPQTGDAASQNQFILETATISEKAYQLLDHETKEYVPQLIADSGLAKERKIELLFQWLDMAIKAEEGKQIERIIGFIDELDASRRPALWSGQRSEKLIQLGEKQVFTKAAAIALHRGVQAFRQGLPLDALRDFARLLRLTRAAETSEEAPIAMKWIKHILLQFRFEQRFLSFLQSYLDPATFKILAQDLIWTSAFYHESYFLDNPSTRDILSYRLNRFLPKLRQLALGRETALLQDLQREMKNEPRQALQFMNNLLGQLSAQSNPLIESFQPLLRGLERTIDRTEPQQRRSKLQEEVRTMLDALLAQGAKFNQGRQDRQIGGRGHVHLGTVAMEPADALPWPFPRADRVALNVFRVLRLQADVRTKSDHTPEYTWQISEK
ncbi:MAG: hypothetical protein M3Q07_07090, partial [Pseudobdellovibrionaceae bacterium]|nr:hypothetical protein [Pseudobdellovibrionaceae bacterium]